MGSGQPGWQWERPAADAILNDGIRVIRNLEFNAHRLWAAKHLHGVVIAALFAPGDRDASLGDIGVEHILAVARRVLPASEEALGQFPGSEPG